MASKRSTRRSKLRRYLAVLAALLVVVGILAAIKWAQIASLISMGEEMEAMGPQPEVVGAATAVAQQWQRSLEAVGTVASVQSVEIRNEVAGVVEELLFDSGDRVQADQALVRLDADRERSQLEAARARLQNARSNYQRSRRLLEQGAFARAQFEEAQAAFEVARGELEALEAGLDQKIVRAPFEGRLGIREISPGQFLEPGTRIAVLDAVGEVFVDFSLPQEEAAFLHEGMEVRIGVRGGREFTGQVVAVNPTVDPVTRNLRARAHVEDPEQVLLPGMFVDVQAILPQPIEVVAVPRTAVAFAPYGNSVFLIEPKAEDAPGMRRTPDGSEVMIARQQFVRVGVSRGDWVQILEGLQPGARVVSAGVFKLRNLSPIVIGEGQPTPELDPQLEND